MITKNDLIGWLKEIGKKLEKKIILVAVGGTALTLLRIKESTRDVDFCLASEDVKLFRNLVKGDKFRVDIFQDGFIFSEQLPADYLEKSLKLDVMLPNIDLRVLSLEDIIITKAARYNERDEADIAAIAKTNKVDINKLKKRFKEVIVSFAGRTEDYEYHFDLILKRHFNV